MDDAAPGLTNPDAGVASFVVVPPHAPSRRPTTPAVTTLAREGCNILAIGTPPVGMFPSGTNEATVSRVECRSLAKGVESTVVIYGAPFREMWCVAIAHLAVRPPPRAAEPSRPTRSATVPMKSFDGICSFPVVTGGKVSDLGGPTATGT